MNATHRLMVSSAVMMLVLANLMLALGALTDSAQRSGLFDVVEAFNLVYVVPAMVAVALAAWLSARDPDFLATPPAFAAATILLLTFVMYFVLALGWFPLMKRVGMVPLQMRTDAPITLFMTLVGTAFVAIPAWWIESRIVRQVQARARAANEGSSA